MSNTANRFDPMKELVNIRDQVSKVMEETFATGSNALAVDIYETEKDVVILTSALLGLQTESLDISITENQQITISGETVSPDEDVPQDAFLRRERKFGAFSRTLTIPVTIVPEEAQAKTFKNGVLMVRLPKAEQDNPRVIKVTPEA